MLYCAKCQLLVREGERCPICGSRKLREAEPTDPVLLMTAGRSESEAVSVAFDDNGVPHEERVCGLGGGPRFLYGKSPEVSVDIFVPFEKIDECREILESIGILNNGRRRGKRTELEEEETEPMSPGRRVFLRIVSAVAFLILIWLAVSLSDQIVYFVKTLFHLQ